MGETVKLAGTETKGAKKDVQVPLQTLILGVIDAAGGRGMFSREATGALLNLQRNKSMVFQEVVRRPGYRNDYDVQQIMAVSEVAGLLDQEYGFPATITKKGKARFDEELREHFPNMSDRAHALKLIHEAAEAPGLEA